MIKKYQHNSTCLLIALSKNIPEKQYVWHEKWVYVWFSLARVVQRKNKVKANQVALDEKKTVEVAGKNPMSYEKRAKINKFEQKSVAKYQPLIQRTVISKPKNITTKEMMNVRIEKRKEKQTEKKLLLENKLA